MQLKVDPMVEVLPAREGWMPAVKPAEAKPDSLDTAYAW